jgi:hypothetical protein
MLENDMKLSEAVQKGVNLSQKVRACYTAELPKQHPKYPLIGPDEAETPAPPEEEELRSFLASLDPEMVYQLILIMYLGRGDFDPDDLSESYEALKSIGSAEVAASQMMEKAPLADYLSDGLAILRKHRIKLDNLLVSPVKSAQRKKS